MILQKPSPNLLAACRNRKSATLCAKESDEPSAPMNHACTQAEKSVNPLYAALTWKAQDN
jgi:hypothetical protein